jgi:membrane fusion protein (multidrug efflux system)
MRRSIVTPLASSVLARRAVPSSPAAALVAFAAVSLAAAAGCGPAAAPKAAAPPPTQVVVDTIIQRDVPLFQEAVGTVAGYVDAEIRARVRGFLEKQLYKDGGRVTAGQVLFTIEGTETEAALASAKANLARAQTAQLHNKAQLERKQALSKSKVVSEQELEDAVASAHDSDNQVEAARAQVRQAELNLSFTKIRSPLTGVAGLALVRPGNLVGQDGPTLLTTVSQLDPVRVNFPMGEIDYVKAAATLRDLDRRDLAWARKQFAGLAAAGKTGGNNEAGDPGLELVLADGTTFAHRGVVVAANRQVDAATGSIQLQALFPNPDGLLRPGQYARVRMRRPSAGASTLAVKESAIIQMQGTASLAVVGPDNRVHLRKVEIGPSAGALRILTGGVTAGERVVVEGVQKVSDGQLVAPQAATAQALPSNGGVAPERAPGGVGRAAAVIR